MPNKIKTSGSTTKLSASRNTNFSVGVDTSDDYGPTSTTGFYNGITPPVGGYTIYVHKNVGGPSIHVANDDSQCIFFLKSFGATGSTISEVLSWSNSRTDIWVQTIDLTTSDLVAAPAGNIYSAATLTNVTTVAQSPFAGGGNAYSLNGTSGYLSLAGNSSWAVGTGDFTIEWFQYQTDTSSFPRIFAIGSYPSTVIQCSIEGGTFYAWCSGANSYGTITSYKNSWQHFAIVRRSGNLYVYRNGTQISTAKANTTNITNTSSTLYLGVENGGNANTWFGGYLTNFRWVKGLAVYTGNFTTPTSSLTLTASANPFGGSNTVAIPSGYTKLLLVP